MKKFLPLTLFMVLVVFLYVGLGLDPKKLPSPLIDKPFPNLNVEDFASKQNYLMQNKLKNQVSLVNVWASWCITCRAEHQMLHHIAQTNKVQMIGVNYKDSKKQGEHFLQTLGNPFAFIVFDNLGKLGLELGVYATPETFLVDKQGIIRFKHIGSITPYIWQNKLLPLISKLAI